MSDKGEYRGIYTAIVDDPAFQSLSPTAKLVFLMVKLQLGPSGIGVLYQAALVEQSGIPSEGVADGMRELSAGGDHAWIRSERNVVWIRNGLRYEPNLTITNDNHRKSIFAHLRTLPKLAIVNDFAEYYGLGEAFPAPSLPDGIPHPITHPLPDQGDGNGEGEGKGKGVLRSGADAPPPAAVVDLTAHRARRSAEGTPDSTARPTRVRKRPPAKVARPPGWTPNAAHREQARSVGLDAGDCAARFCRWADANGAWFADWDERFSLWLDDDAKRAPHLRKAAGAEDFDVTKEVFE